MSEGPEGRTKILGVNLLFEGDDEMANMTIYPKEIPDLQSETSDFPTPVVLEWHQMTFVRISNFITTLCIQIFLHDDIRIEISNL